MRALKFLYLIGITILVLNQGYGQIKMSKNQKDEFLNDLVLSFKDEFLWKEKGKEIAEKLNYKIKNGDYLNIKEADFFVETLNRDLFILSNDLHLNVELMKKEPSNPSNTSKSITSSTIQKERISNGTYYLKFDVFPRLSPDFKNELGEVMSSLENPKSIIIDLRDNSGGSDETVNYLIGYFFKEKKQLATSYQWNTAPKKVWAISKDKSNTFSETDLIILTSQSTFSAAEIFTQRLQSLNRAIVIGEKTRGAAHRTMTYLMNDIFLLHWPYERSVPVENGKDIEGVGIVPNYFAHYNEAKMVAIQFIQNGKVNESKEILVPDKTKLIDKLIRTLNSNSKKSINKFAKKYVQSHKSDKVSRKLSKFKTIWNDGLNSELTNIHYLSENMIRLFIKTTYGTREIKIILDKGGINSILTKA